MELPEATEATNPISVGSAEEVRIRRKTLETVLVQCHRALEQLRISEVDGGPAEEEEEGDEAFNRSETSTPVDEEADELCNLLKSRVESPDFLEKLGSFNIAVPPNGSDDSTSWDMITPKDSWNDNQITVDDESDDDSYVLVRQEDIVDGIACFMATYLLSLKNSKELTPNQLQEALCKTFSVKKKKSRLRKAWDGSKVIYNVASWSATAIGIYQNPALLRAASVVFSTSCRAIAKLL